MTGSRTDTLLAFLTSNDGGEDHLGTPESVAAWMGERGLLTAADAPPSEEDVRRVRRVRAALVALVTANSGGPEPDPRTVPLLDSVTAAAPMVVRADASGGLVVRPSVGGVPGALAALVHSAYEAQLLGEFDRFKACQSCGWCYYDRTKNRSRRWCDMASCGSREKTRAYRARKRAAEATD